MQNLHPWRGTEMTRLRSAMPALALLVFWQSAGFAQPGTLVHDGPATPEQISMYLPVTGTLAATTATVRYRPTASSTWSIAHPLYRIRPAFIPDSTADAFAGVITGLTPGTQYTVEVTVDLGGGSTSVQTLVATTRDLPPPSPPANKTIPAGSTVSQIQSIFNGLVPGDVVQFQNGTYPIDMLHLNKSGTDTQPITI